MKTRQDKTFGQLLREFMKDRGIDPKTLADLVGVTFNTVYNYLQDSTTPKLDIAVRIADALEVDLEYLIPDSWRLNFE